MFKEAIALQCRASVQPNIQGKSTYDIDENDMVTVYIDGVIFAVLPLVSFNAIRDKTFDTVDE